MVLNGKLKGKDIEHLETFERDGKLYYRLNVLRNTRLRASIIQNTLVNIGVIRCITREIHLNADKKRFWLGTLKSVDDGLCNESMPISMSYFGKSGI
jgi:CRISPR/Cas system-associated protein Csm6